MPYKRHFKASQVKRKRMSSGETIVDMESEVSENIKSVIEKCLLEFITKNSDLVTKEICSSRTLTHMMNDCVRMQDEKIEELRKENEQLRKRLALAEGAVTRNELMIKKLECKVVDLTARSMRDNIVIKNVVEEAYEDERKIEEKVMKIMEEELKIPAEERKKVVIERAHRIGKKNGQKNRNIVVKLNGKGKGIVMRHVKNLRRGSVLKVTDQFPSEVHSKLDKLWPIFENARKEGKKTKWNVDQLQIEGKTYKAPTDKNNDINLNIPEEAMKVAIKHSPVTTNGHKHFQAHSFPVQLKSSL